MRNTRWIYRDNKKNYNIKKYSRDMLSILESRGLTTEEEIEKFIQCSLSDLRDPFLLKDMEKAVNFILEKRDKKETIAYNRRRNWKIYSVQSFWFKRSFSFKRYGKSCKFYFGEER